MRRFLVIGIILAAGTAHAGDAPAPRWVGTWSGKITAKGCADDGKRTVALDVAMTSQGGLRSNGDLLVEGLGDLDWTADAKHLALGREGLKASLKLSGKSAKLAVTTDGGCTIKGTLKRTTSGIAACDQVRALATIKSQCSTLASETRGQSLVDVDGSWKAWSKLKGKKKKAQEAACKEQVATLTTDVQQCVGAVASLTGLPECDAYIRAIDRYLQCDKIPQQARDGARQGIEAMEAGWRDMSGVPDDVKQQTNDACKQAVDAIQQGASAMGCAL
jgi:hypothetical protein